MINTRKPCVIYIGSCSRSGSTLLDMLLGTAQGIFSAGEVMQLWDHAILKRALCSCGADYSNCPVWSQVLTERNLGGPPNEIAKKVTSIQKKYFLFKHAGWFSKKLEATNITAELEWYRDVNIRLYNRLFQVTGAHTIVDSSKFPQEAILLDSSPQIDLRFVHLIRDPRGVVSSWKRGKKQYDGRKDLARVPVHKGAARWTLVNLGCERIVARLGNRALTLHYESLTANPDKAMQELTETWNLPKAQCERLYTETVHVIAGNPDRFNRRQRNIYPDERWRNDLGQGAKLITWLLTAPLQRRHI